MNVDTYIVQPFHIHRKKLAPSPAQKAKTRHHALADGQRVAASKPGVAVLHVVADDETGEVTSLEVIARHGEIPDEFEEQIQAG